MEQEKPKRSNRSRASDCIKTHDGRLSVQKITGVTGLLLSLLLGLLMSLGYLEESIKSILMTTISGCFALLGANDFSKNN